MIFCKGERSRTTTKICEKARKYRRFGRVRIILDLHRLCDENSLVLLMQ